MPTYPEVDTSSVTQVPPTMRPWLHGYKGSGLLDEFPNLLAYVARGAARPAFKRAFDAQLAVFNAASGG